MTEPKTTQAQPTPVPASPSESPSSQSPSAPRHASPAAAGWRPAFKRAMREFKADDLQDRAAALTYYGIQSIFPGLLVLVSLLGLVGSSATPLINSIAKAAPASVRHTVLTTMTSLQHGHAAAGTLAIVGILGGLWSASSYVAGFMRASNVIYDVPEGRPVWKTTPVRLGVTVLVVVLLAASIVMVTVTGSLATKVGNGLGIGSVAVITWEVAKWPVLLIIVSVMFTILYWASPNARHRFRWISPGSALAVASWIIASGLFALYVANFGHYNKVYGSLGGVIVFLIWMWISNVAVLFGAEFNAELERGRAIAEGMPPDQEPFTELRDTRKLDGLDQTAVPGPRRPVSS